MRVLLLPLHLMCVCLQEGDGDAPTGSAHARVEEGKGEEGDPSSTKAGPSSVTKVPMATLRGHGGTIAMKATAPTPALHGDDTKAGPLLEDMTAEESSELQWYYDAFRRIQDATGAAISCV